MVCIVHMLALDLNCLFSMMKLHLDLSIRAPQSYLKKGAFSQLVFLIFILSCFSGLSVILLSLVIPEKTVIDDILTILLDVRLHYRASGEWVCVGDGRRESGDGF